jgi:hypothetical protein
MGNAWFAFKNARSITENCQVKRYVGGLQLFEIGTMIWLQYFGDLEIPGFGISFLICKQRECRCNACWDLSLAVLS